MASLDDNSKKENIEDITKNIEAGYTYFRDNFRRYYEYMVFTYKTSLSPAALAALENLQKPPLQFNILEAYINRLCGEFSKMDPGFNVRAKDGVKLINPQLIELVEAHLKAAFLGSETNSLGYQIYREILSGGFSVAKIFTDYADNMSFNQKIFIEKVFDPTLTAFDPMARTVHKGDGNFCAELFPKTVEEVRDLYGSDAVAHLDFGSIGGLDGFSWSYRAQQQEIVLLAEYSVKKIRKQSIVKLTNGHVMTKKEYERLLARTEELGQFEAAPEIIQERISPIETIDKYTVTQNKILKYEKTNFNMLPLVFFDGNSVQLRDSADSPAYQMTRPYLYQAADAQKMKNLAGQSLCNEIENMTPQKWAAAIEGIPDNKDYAEAYSNPHSSHVLLYRQFKNDDPDVNVNPPRDIPRQAIPPELTNTFTTSDATVQAILGSYDAALGINDNELSGVAIMQGAMHSNATAMPYTMGFIQSWSRCAQIYLDLLPKYYVTPRSIPIIKPNGKRDYYEINKDNRLSFDYDASALEVEVKPGVNFAVQKQIALKTIIQLMSASEQFAKFINQDGLEILLDNIDIRGIDNLKQMADQFMMQEKQMAEQAQAQQAQQPTPEQLAQKQIEIEAAKVAQKSQEAQLKSETELSKAASSDAIENKEADIKFIEVMSKIKNEDLERMLKEEQIDAEQARTAVELISDIAKLKKEHMEINEEDNT